MGITDTIRGLLGGDASGGVEITSYECGECGNTFDSAKTPDRAQCMECLSNDVEPVE